MVKRDIENTIKKLINQYPVVTLTGPRQSGKTTLLRSIFKEFPYVNLENPDTRQLALDDPRGFLNNFPQGAILDEVQNAPELFSYIQVMVDDNKDLRFILSGSHNFLLLENISQSLAGRAAILKLLPFSIHELYKNNITSNYESVIFNGLFPGIYDRNLEPSIFYSSYINTYLERDVRQIKKIGDLHQFSGFLRLVAGRVGQLLNLNSLATDAGISPNTVKAWLSILEASYIIHYLPPFHKNFNKRITKAPKLYFSDTGLVCSLLGIENEKQVKTHYAKGALFENMIINEFLKARYNRGLTSNLYYWNNKNLYEIDLILESGNKTTAIEIKSGMTLQKEYFKNLKYWQKLSGESPENCYVIYGGKENYSTGKGSFVSWQDLHKVT
ncbi:MAG: ATP-binding protein [Bacteroidales bacterium]